MENTLIIIDGNSLLNRAYYAIQRPMMTKDGMYTQGIFGFLNMLGKILKDYAPSHIAVAFDRKAPTFRHMEYTEYKAGRKKMPPELAMEFEPLKEILRAMNIQILEIDGFEADDILGTVSLAAEQAGMQVFVVTGDKDAFQLASDRTTVIYTKRGTSEFDAYDTQAVLDRYQLTPSQFIDLKGLMGDSSDNIPGIPGVGEKTAIKLLLEYGSVENLIASLDQMKKSKLKEKLEENAQLAVMSKRLATICRDIPLEFDFESMRYEEPDYDALIELYKKLEFNSFIRRLNAEGKAAASFSPDSRSFADAVPDEKAGDMDNPYAQIQSIRSDEVTVVHAASASEIARALGALQTKEQIWLKVFHDNAHVRPLQIWSVCMLADTELYVIDWTAEAAGLLAGFFDAWQGRICGHDLKDSYYALFRGKAAAVSGRAAAFGTFYDSAVSGYLIDPQKSSYELQTLILEYFHKDFPSDRQILEEVSAIDLFGNSWETQGKLALQIFEAASSLVRLQSVQLCEKGLLKVFTEAELPLIEVLASMECEGIRADRRVLEETGSRLKEQIDRLTGQIYDLAGETFNINSPKQLGVILFEKLGLPNGKKTKTGYSTSADILEKIAEEHEIVPLILEYRMLTKLKGTYVDGMLPLIDEEEKVHAHFQQTVTTTGRLSCTEPNLQNIPIRQETGRQFRRVFTKSGPEKVLVGADYSQVELRIMAHLSGDEALLQAFRQGDDIHTITAARVFHTAMEDVTPLQRSRAKAVNFGVIYGISAFGLSEDLRISRKEAQQYIDDYFAAHPGVKAYMNDMVEFCRENGYVSTILGRRRYISEIHASNFMTRQLGERLAMNTPVQGSAADIMKLAMIQTYRRLNSEGLGARLVLQVHDELILDCPLEEEEKVRELLEECMTNAVKLNLVLAAEVHSGNSWYDLK
ncbi:MAG: DNA polymerase I [Anaerovoracaceae bacterium]